jgi:hypothetical protein
MMLLWQLGIDANELLNDSGDRLLRIDHATQAVLGTVAVEDTRFQDADVVARSPQAKSYSDPDQSLQRVEPTERAMRMQLGLR